MHPRGVPRNPRWGFRNFRVPAVNSRERPPVEVSSDPPDSDLVARARGADREEVSLLYRRHQAVVCRFARGMTGSSALAEDVVQDVFLALMRDLDRYDPQR